MTPYYITLKFHLNNSALIEPFSGNYNARDYTKYNSIQYSVLALNVYLLFHQYMFNYKNLLFIFCRN